MFGSPELAGHLDLAKSQADLTIRGVAAFERDLGVGDYNGDGIQDLALGTGSVLGRSGDSVLVLFGSSGLEGTIDFALQSPDMVIRGSDGGQIGRSIAAGDINGDGMDDMILGMYGAPSLAVVEVIFGSVDLPGTVDLRTQNSDLRIVGDYYGGFGTGLVADDFDGDGIEDIAIGSPYASFYGRGWAGKVEVIRGQPDLAGVRDLRDQPAELTIVGGRELLALGSRSSLPGNGLRSGDVNGDGIGDLIVAAVLARSADGQLYAAGEGYAIFGGAAMGCIRDLAIEPAEIIVHGSGYRDYLGWGTGVGDVNGDGLDDVIFLAAWGDGFDDTREAAGDAYILFGRPDTAKVKTLLEVIQTLPEDAFIREGHRQAMLRQAQSIEAMLGAGHTAGAARLLEQMERHLDPCDGQIGPIGPNDWLQSCATRVQLRCIVNQMREALPSLSN